MFRNIRPSGWLWLSFVLLCMVLALGQCLTESIAPCPTNNPETC